MWISTVNNVESLWWIFE